MEECSILVLRPTFNGSDLSVEVYIFDFSGNLYDRTIKVFL